MKHRVSRKINFFQPLPSSRSLSLFSIHPPRDTLRLEPFTGLPDAIPEKPLDCLLVPHTPSVSLDYLLVRSILLVILVSSTPSTEHILQLLGISLLCFLLLGLVIDQCPLAMVLHYELHTRNIVHVRFHIFWIIIVLPYLMRRTSPHFSPIYFHFSEVLTEYML